MRDPIADAISGRIVTDRMEKHGLKPPPRAHKER
jgi:hypothetical protein